MYIDPVQPVEGGDPAIFFPTIFTGGNFEFGAQASAIAVTAGASADAAYSDGVAVFTLPKGGLMYEASIAGQKFGFKPLGSSPG